MKRYIYLLFSVFSLVFLFSGCDDDDNVRNGNISVIGVSSDSDKKYISIEDDKTHQLEAFVMPNNKTSKITYSLIGTKSGAIEITSDGLITPLVKTPSEGDIPSPLGVDTILLTLDDDPSIFVKYPVRVYSHIKLVTSITLQSAGQFPEVKTGKTFDLSQYVTVNPANATEKGVAYTSSDESIAMVDANGLITAKSAGEAVIRIKTVDVRSGDISTESKVTVKDDVINYVDLNRTGWSVTTSHPYVSDNTVVGTAESLIDNGVGPTGKETCLSLYRPGKGNIPETDIVYFIIDMGSEKEFEYFRIRHRQDNALQRLRVWGVSLYGSNDGNSFTEIVKSVVIPGAKEDASALESGNIVIPKSKYRYLKMTYDVYEYPSNSGTLQISEFNLGNIVIE